MRAVTIAPHETMLMYNVACLYSLAGEPDRAFEYLEQAFEMQSWGLELLQVAAYYDPLRDDPRFDDLVRRMNFPPSSSRSS